MDGIVGQAGLIDPRVELQLRFQRRVIPDQVLTQVGKEPR